jgi:hypothetical protein
MSVGVVLGLGLLAALLLVLSIGAMYSVAGTWDRVTGESDAGLSRDRVVLAQLGPIVIGRRDTSGGYQSFFGYTWFRRLYLSRRDHGLRLLTRQGFPEPIAKILEGRVMVRLKLELSEDKLFLNGTLISYQVNFTHTPPEVTGMRALAPSPLQYRRADLVKAQTQTALNGAVVLK